LAVFAAQQVLAAARFAQQDALAAPWLSLFSAAALAPQQAAQLSPQQSEQFGPQHDAQSPPQQSAQSAQHAWLLAAPQAL
jgi:hypothetical protein